MNFLCQLSNTLINCCSQLSAVVQMSLITNGPIGLTPPFSLPLLVSYSSLTTLPPLVFPAARALQGTRCQRSRNCVLIMLHCFLDCFQPSGSLISNFSNKSTIGGKQKAQLIPFLSGTFVQEHLNKAASKPTVKPYRKCADCIVCLICLVAMNFQGGMHASNNLSLFIAGNMRVHQERLWGKKEGG